MTETVRVHEPYVRAQQQHAAAMMGIYIFLATEIMLFGGLFAVAFTIRVEHPEEYIAASKQMHLWIAGINTIVLLTSSFSVALAVHLARIGAARLTLAALGASATLGLLFLVLKGVEYHREYVAGKLPVLTPSAHFSTPVEHQFMNLYMIATSLHAIHLSIGVGMVAVLIARIGARRLPLPGRAVVVQVSGVYWHFVDIVWIYLFPLLYLIDRRPS